MLEGVLGDGIERLLVHELVSLERVERRAKLAVGELGRCCLENRLREHLTDHGRRLQDLLLALRQTVDARGQHSLYRSGHREALDRRDKAIATARSLQASR